jgi:hypothetical protein
MFVCSWEGLEHLRARLCELAASAHATHEEARRQAHEFGGYALGSMCVLMRHPELSNQAPKCLRDAVAAHQALADFHGRLISEHNLDFFLVRKEWLRVFGAPATDLQRCESHIGTIIPGGPAV